MASSIMKNEDRLSVKWMHQHSARTKSTQGIALASRGCGRWWLPRYGCHMGRIHSDSITKTNYAHDQGNSRRSIPYAMQLSIVKCETAHELRKPRFRSIDEHMQSYPVASAAEEARNHVQILPDAKESPPCMFISSSTAASPPLSLLLLVPVRHTLAFKVDHLSQYVL